MLASLLALTLSLAPSWIEDAPEPSDSDLRRAHALLSGVWDFVEYVDNGESLGMNLIRSRYAKNGQLTIGNRVFETRSPDSGTPSLKAYRINPAAVPQQINFTTEDDRIQKGIYKFENDELVVCYAKNDGAERPDSFASPAGSNLILMRMKIGAAAGTEKTGLDQTPSIPAVARPNPVSNDAPRPTADQLRRDQDLLSGLWSCTSLIDDGQPLGTALVAKSVLAGGKLTVSNRSVEFSEPDSGRSRVLSYRINPATDVKQIDIINEDKQVFRGIYKFDGDSLVVCLHHTDEGERPREFASPAGSNNMLLTLKMEDAKVPAAMPISDPSPSITDPGPIAKISADPPILDFPKPDAPRTIKTVATTPADWAPIPARRPSEAELQQAHMVLAGAWDIVKVENNGENYSANLVREKLARDGQVVISNRSLRVITPETGDKRISAFKINPATTPRQIDVINSFDQMMPGIYTIEGDRLTICLHRGDTGQRPTEFVAPAGSNNLLLTLRMADRATPEDEPKPEPLPMPAPPSADELKQNKEAQVRSLLIGSWVTQDKDGKVTTVLRPDGSYIATRDWSKNRLFKDQQTTTQGRWSYSQGLVRADVRSATESKMLGRSFAARVQSIGEESMVATDFLGTTKNYRRLR